MLALLGEHICHTTPNRHVKIDWLAYKFVYTLRHNSDMITKGLIAEVIKRWCVKLSNNLAYITKRKILDLIQGVGREQFTHIGMYSNELINLNPNSTMKIQCVDSSGGPIFERVYACLEACKDAFATTCRPLIGLDACFFKKGLWRLIDSCCW